MKIVGETKIPSYINITYKNHFIEIDQIFRNLHSDVCLPAPRIPQCKYVQKFTKIRYLKRVFSFFSFSVQSLIKETIVKISIQK